MKGTDTQMHDTNSDLSSIVFRLFNLLWQTLKCPFRKAVLLV